MRNVSCFILFLTELIFSGCKTLDAARSETKIVNGHEINPKSDSPAVASMVGLVVRGTNNNNPVCSGTLVGLNLILTARHCVQDADLSTMYVYFASNETGLFGKKPATRTIVKSQTVLDDFPGDIPVALNLDMALITFSGDLPKGYAPIAILPVNLQDQALQPGTDMLIAGYGSTYSEATATDGKRRETNMTLKGHYEEQFARGILHLASDDSNACRGDSGGPAYVKVNGSWYVVGVTEGLDKRLIDKKSVCESMEILYTNASLYGRWLQRAAGINIGTTAFDPLKFGSQKKRYSSFQAMCKDPEIDYGNWVTLASVSTSERQKDCTDLEQAIRDSKLLVIYDKVLSLDFFAFFPNVTSLSFEADVEDFTPLAQLRSLESLSIDAKHIPNPSPLAALTSLQLLAITDSDLNDISFISRLTKLYKVNLMGNAHLQNVAALGALTNLEDLSLKNCDVISLPSLQSRALTKLDLANNHNLSDISSLASVGDSLINLYVTGTRVTKNQCDSLKASHPNLRCATDD